MKSNIENEIKNKGYVLYEVRGSSMWPLIRQNRDLAVIVKKPDKLQKYDIVLYKREKKLILHRIIKINNGKYVIAGDNCFQKEFDITDTNIIGILKSVERNAKLEKKQNSIETDSVKQKLYSRTWCALYPIRSIYKKTRHAFAKTKLGQTIKNKIKKLPNSQQL